MTIHSVIKVCGLFLLLTFSVSANAQPTTWEHRDHKGNAWVKNVSRPYTISQGLEGRHLALWASHGRFYDINRKKWRWQRPPLYTTCEDLFTQTIVVPFLIPMLENAGAVVFTPRERDWQRNEVIVDNDLSSSDNYQESTDHQQWQEAPLRGFSYHPGHYTDGENPFMAGTARMITTTKSKNKFAYASYQPQIPETGRYAVYVSYQTHPLSIDDAHYTVWHQGQKTDIHVNQQMGGSTWVYIGTFNFDAGCNDQNRVVLTNQSSGEGVVTTDAVRFGGGMGNIERGGDISHLPRCLEGARYYAQWAGMPYNVYSSKNGENDYGDDINARSLMLNELCGGSVYAPDSTGRKVPIELSLAVHSDAGYNEPYGDGIYGSLTICTTHHGDSLLAAGCSRDMSKELASELLDNATIDIQHRFRTWTPREVYDRNYSETRLPVVPSAIFETLSHQSFNDMRYGLDPNFRFTLARSIYKTLLRFINKKHGNSKPVISPLTPDNFRIEFAEGGKGEVRISWSPKVDPDEPTAAPSAYLLYVAEGDKDFDNGTLINGTAATLRLKKDALVHFRVAAVNKGGISFPSPILSACYRSENSKTILIVDGFHRLSSPAVKENGFDIDEDPGVSYGLTSGFLGHQRRFDLGRIGIEDSTGLGYTTNDMEGMFVGGNDFDYVRTHAKAIFETGRYNIVSCSSEAISLMPLYRFNLLDLLLGLERNDGYSLLKYKALPPKLRQAIGQFTSQGGHLLVSGSYVGSDIRGSEELRFLNQVMKCKLSGTYREPSETIQGLGVSFDFYHQLCPQHYAATCCDVLMPADDQSFSAMVYNNGTSAAVAYKGSQYRSFVMGFPIECIKQDHMRHSIMAGILNFLLE